MRSSRSHGVLDRKFAGVHQHRQGTVQSGDVDDVRFACLRQKGAPAVSASEKYELWMSPVTPQATRAGRSVG